MLSRSAERLVGASEGSGRDFVLTKLEIIVKIKGVIVNKKTDIVKMRGEEWRFRKHVAKK